MNHECPVCGFDKLSQPIEDHLICPCCGIHFGYHDAGPISIEKIHTDLRNRWILNGCEWFSKATLPPENWNPISQLKNAGYIKD